MSLFINAFSSQVAQIGAALVSTAAAWLTAKIINLVSTKVKNSKVASAMKFLAEVTRDSVMASEQTIASNLRQALKDKKITSAQFKEQMDRLGADVFNQISDKVFSKLKDSLNLPDAEIYSIIRNKMESVVPEAKTLVRHSNSIDVAWKLPNGYFEKPTEP